MAIQSTSEVGLFQEFLVHRVTGGPLTGSLDEAVEEFRRYQQELTELQTKLRVGLEQCDRGEVKPVDADLIKERLRERLASESHAE